MFGLSAGELAFIPLSLALVGGLAAAVFFRPKVGVLLWLLTVAFVPFWMGASFVVYFMPTSLLGIVLLAAVRPGLPRLGSADLVALFFFISCLAPLLVGGATQSTIFGALAYWLVAFLLGRLLPGKVDVQWIYTCAAVIFTVVAGLAVLEFFLGWNPFVTLGPANDLHVKWGNLQGRGSLVRAEGAFGHSIALGCSLALALPLTMAASLRVRTRLLMVVVLLGGVAVTISRISMLCAVLSVLLTTAFAAGIPRQLKVGILALLAVAGAVLAPSFVAIFQSAGDEATNSANYRGDLLQLVPDIHSLGVSSAAYRSPTGELFFGRFQSIDSQFLFTGLTYGWFALISGLVLLAAGVIIVVLGRATPATVAVIAQIPALATVALITQYSMWFWFMAGLAVCSQVNGFRAAPDQAEKRRFEDLPGPGRTAGSQFTSHRLDETMHRSVRGRRAEE